MSPILETVSEFATEPAAGRKLVVRGMFLIRHEQVSVVRFAVQHARDARPANALFARDRYFNAVRGKDLDHRFVWWYEESLAGAGELDFEALVLGARGRRGRKIFSDRKSVVEGKSGSVRLDLGGRRVHKI